MSWGSIGAAAIGVGGSMLADKNDGGGGSVQQLPTLGSAQQKLQNIFSSAAVNEAIRARRGEPARHFTGDRVAGITPNQQSAFGFAGGLGGGIGGGLSAFESILGQFDPRQGQQFLGDARNLLGQSTQQFDPQTVLDALAPGRQLAQSQFEQETVPFLSEKFGATSGASGAFNKALSEAGANLSLGLSAQAAPFLIEGQQNQLNRQLQGSALAGELSGIPGQLAQQGVGIGQGVGNLITQLFNMGALQRDIGQEEINALMQQFSEADPFNRPGLQLGAPVLGQGGIENIITPPGPGLGSAIGPALGQLASSPQFQQNLSNLFSRNTTSGGDVNSLNFDPGGEQNI